MTTLPNFPLVSQRTTVTSDGHVSEDALFDCVPASIGSIMLWLEGKSAWDNTINPDKLKDAAYGDAYTGGTSAERYVSVCHSLGFALEGVETPDPSHTIGLAREFLAAGKPVIFTILDPYVDTNLPQYQGWTHVEVWFGDDGAGLTAMDPFIAQPVYKSDATWESLLRANQVWTVEKEPEIVTIDLTTPGVSSHFTAVPGNSNQWQCIQTGKVIQYGILAAYQKYGNSALCGLTYLGLPKSDEMAIDPVKYPHVVKQYYERGCLVYDPSHLIDNPPGSGSVYAAHCYDDTAPGLDPAIAGLEAQIVQLKQVQGIAPNKVANRLQAVALLAKQQEQLALAPLS